MQTGVSHLIYQIYLQQIHTGIFMEKGSGSKLPCLSVKKMRALYQPDNFNIIGEIGNFTRAPDSHDTLVTGSGKEVSVLPRGSLIWPFEWITGYIPVGENLYIAAVRSMIPSFLRHRTRM
jgi:phospholipase/carboxylesterase